MDNPYQAPNADPVESAATKHRSFRLAPGPTSLDASVTVGKFRAAIVFTLMQQLPLLLLSAMLLDGGLVFKRVAIASVAFWILTLMVMIRRGRNITDSDILVVKWGYLPLLFATCIFWLVASTFMF
jgi:hypothetical protein